MRYSRALQGVPPCADFFICCSGQAQFHGSIEKTLLRLQAVPVLWLQLAFTYQSV